jgi:hypothetical protein
LFAAGGDGLEDEPGGVRPDVQPGHSCSDTASMLLVAAQAEMHAQ